MIASGTDGSVAWLLVTAAALLGLVLSPLAENLIAKRLPRLGGLPAVRVRITTAAITAALCVAFSLRFGLDYALPAFLFLAILGVQLSRIDIALHLLPNPLVLMLLAGGFLLLLMPGFLNMQADGLLRAALGALILFTGYLSLGLISPGAIGMGDVKLAAPVGLYLGYLGWTQLLYGGLLCFLLNGVVTLFFLGRKGRKQATEVPHGPSMIAATAAMALLST
ncbi:leader peptidase (prepilin peptidase)/N-methyltransferase [Pseudarthrobacter oxydans]|uniref:Leader peptidase (Prepilin peptidase)/N-methyltransferase n=1 Tax=Pseudarthrobacter oxydans TaxID=1671 RepID=A0AAW8N663_PSEOX|nr:A24 family peptidase [Pseudarthrobacter oxydans]MDR6791247.1 leader peptidase (prepilin peptidase)/N-methyltransferase [Pseudarthrobacter oxydans]MDR7162324.1 leader peptidase (prepilin peptidase)/N-methyltransferase [Pseudarthrobacter oxydans]